MVTDAHRRVRDAEVAMGGDGPVDRWRARDGAADDPEAPHSSSVADLSYGEDVGVAGCDDEPHGRRRAGARTLSDESGLNPRVGG